MPGREIENLLKEAVHHLSRKDMYTFQDYVMKAQAILPELDENDPMRGEITLMSAFLEYGNPEKLTVLLKQAQAQLKGRSRLVLPRDGGIENYYGVYSIWGTEPGRTDEFMHGEQGYSEAAEVLQAVTGVGFEIRTLQKAQLAYYRGELKEAQQYAETCRKVGRGAQRRESMIDVYALEILAGVGKHTMNNQLWQKNYNALRAIGSGKMDVSRASCEHAQVISTMMDLSLGMLHDVPSWGKTGDLGAIPAPWGYELLDDSMLASVLPDAMIAHIEYLSYSGEPVRALMAAGTLQKVYGFKNALMTPYLELLRAGCYLQLDKPKRAKEAIEDALRYIIPDRLWMIATEFEPVFGDLILEVAKAHSSEAAEKIEALSRNYMEKLAMLRTALLKSAGESLTNREKEIAELVIEGYSNAEIAEKLNITVRTVRAHLEHAFAKFNVSRRSQLITAINQAGSKRLAHWVK